MTKCAPTAPLTPHPIRSSRNAPLGRKVRDWLRQGCDCVVIAGKYDPIAAVEAMLPHLAPSRPFAIYSEFIEVRRDGGTGKGKGWAWGGV